MKAAVLFETKGKLSVEDVDISEPKKDEVMVKISASGLCHTDWETMRGYQPVNLPCLLYTSPSPRDAHESRMPSSA